MIDVTSNIERPKIKIAVCMSGQIRTWEFCKENIQNFLKNDGEYEIDYFIHTWDNNDFTELVISEENSIIKFTHKKENDFQNFLEFYKPKLYKIESNQKFKEKLYKKWQPTKKDEPVNTLFLMYSFYKSIILKKLWERKNNFKYDFVVKLRPDINFFGVNLESQLSILNKSFNKKNNKINFISYFYYQRDWNKSIKEMQSNYFGPDLYWLFKNEDAEKFSTFYNEKVKFDRKNKNKFYTQYYHTYKLGFNPLNFDEEELKEPLVCCVRLYHVPFLNLLGNMNTREYQFNFVLLSSFFKPGKFITNEINNILKKSEDFLNTTLEIEAISFFNKNSFLIDMIKKYLKYLRY
jgi:hypothetical protein